MGRLVCLFFCFHYVVQVANPRIRLFGRAVGILDPEGYHDGICDVVCQYY